ncbi:MULTISPECIES: TadE family protein [Caldilinea]|jgi:Flp pilus assembly protein TadG|uniref:TadE family protein n=2 Tax=Caldilineaceae TaxID=475964 RepID=UPI0002F68165|nr:MULTISPECIES: TadE family protein [Caldilinea]GIV72955.1 MAG: hypothetical protein KatS3mg049_1511 [Caldilinea sp.]
MKPRSGQERGQDLVEYALILPLFLFLVIGFIEISVLFFSYVTISNAAREGARAAVAVPSAGCPLSCIDAQAAQAARRLTAGLIDENLTVSVTRPDADSVRVEVRYRADLLTRMMIETLGGRGFVTLSAASTMRREG